MPLSKIVEIYLSIEDILGNKEKKLKVVLEALLNLIWDEIVFWLRFEARPRTVNMSLSQYYILLISCLVYKKNIKNSILQICLQFSWLPWFWVKSLTSVLVYKREILTKWLTQTFLPCLTSQPMVGWSISCKRGAHPNFVGARGRNTCGGSRVNWMTTIPAWTTFSLPWPSSPPSFKQLQGLSGDG